MPGGRPKYELPEGWKETMLELGKKGKGKIHMASALGMCRSQFYDLEKENEEFMHTSSQAMDLCQIWWENVGQEGLFMGGKDNPFQGGVYNFTMGARFGWSNKSETKSDVTSGGEKITGITREIVDPKGET
jgi:hypothetical protein